MSDWFDYSVADKARQMPDSVGEVWHRNGYKMQKRSRVDDRLGPIVERRIVCPDGNLLEGFECFRWGWEANYEKQIELGLREG
jgi:hypothetical protein